LNWLRALATRKDITTVGPQPPWTTKSQKPSTRDT
jgi:hypothetical protein